MSSVTNMDNKTENISDDKSTEMVIVYQVINEEAESELNHLQSDIPSTSKSDAYCSRDKDIKTEAPIGDPRLCRNNRVVLYGEDKGPIFYPVRGKIVSPVIITKNLPEAFKFMPVYGRPKTKVNLEEFQNTKVREFVGCDLNDDDFNKLADFCSPNHLKVGSELTFPTSYPTHEPLSDKELNKQDDNIGDSLCIVKKLKLRLEKDIGNRYIRQFKYRGVRCFPAPQESDEYKINRAPLEPGKDMIFRIRLYRPFCYSGRERNYTRHSLFSNDIVLLGRQKLTQLRDRIACANDFGTRVDMSENPEDIPITSAKEMFPSGFLFINNVFYVDTRQGCKDNSRPIREWTLKRGLGEFPHKDMTALTLDQLPLKLGHPEVYIHQGNCEHLFTFSEVRLLNPSDPLQQSQYPFHTAVSHHQVLYCTTCAEFGAKWFVTGCEMVPFDPAFFCDTCFKLYLYKDGKKVTSFQAYSYKGNQINELKPME